MSNQYIRKAAKEDASRIAEILIFTKRVAYRSIFQDDTTSFCHMQVLDLAIELRDDEKMRQNIYVYDDGIVKGMIHWSIEKDNSSTIQLHELYVEPFFQGQGIGHELIKACIEQAKELNANKIQLWVLEDNESARRFYENHSFCKTGIREYEDGTTVWQLEYERVIEE